MRIALAVAISLALAVAFGAVVKRAGAKTEVVWMADDVPAGHVITRADLSTVDVAGPLDAISATDLGRVVGQTAAVPLATHDLLRASKLTPAGGLQPGQARVGIALTAAQLPGDGVEAGDLVEVLQLPGGSSGDSPVGPAQPLVPAARVWSSRPDPGRSGGALLTLVIPTRAVDQVSSAAAAGQISIVAVPVPGLS